MIRKVFIDLLLAGLIAACCLPAMAAKENFDRSKPHISFIAKSGGINLSGFDQMRGLGVETEATEYVDDSDPVVRKRPGRTKYSNVTLERVYQGATDLEDWANESARGKVQRREISLVMYSRSNDAIRSFNLIDCFPVAWSLETNDDGFMIERLTLSVDRVQTVQ